MFKIGCGALLVGCAVMFNSASDAYLPQIGPSPLRFRPKSAVLSIVPFSFPPLIDPANPATNNQSKGSNPPPLPVEDSKPEPFGPSLPEESSTLNDTNSDSSVATPAPVLPNNSLRITPQMLLEYFLPIPGETNARLQLAPAGTFLPPEIEVPEFGPPQPAPASSAIYRSN